MVVLVTFMLSRFGCDAGYFEHSQVSWWRLPDWCHANDGKTGGSHESRDARFDLWRQPARMCGSRSGCGCGVEPDVLAGVEEREAWFREGLQKINDKYGIFSEIRGKGLLLGAALNEEWQGRARDVLVAAGQQGLMVLVAGANVVRFTPSLVITKQEVEQGLAKLDKAISTLVAA